MKRLAPGGYLYWKHVALIDGKKIYSCALQNIYLRFSTISFSKHGYWNTLLSACRPDDGFVMS